MRYRATNLIPEPFQLTLNRFDWGTEVFTQRLSLMGTGVRRLRAAYLLANSLLPSNLLASFCRILLIHIQNTDRSAIRRESQGDGSSNAATATGYDGDFAVKSETLRLGVLICQRETPLFHGMKSSCPFSSALVRTSPFATLIT